MHGRQLLAATPPLEQQACADACRTQLPQQRDALLCLGIQPREVLVSLYAICITAAG